MRPAALDLRVVMHIKLFVKEMSVNFPGSGDAGTGDDFRERLSVWVEKRVLRGYPGSKDLLGNGLVD